MMTVNPAAEWGYRGGTIMAGSGHLRVRVTPGEATMQYVRSRLPAQEAEGRRNRAAAHSYSLAPGPRSATPECG